MILATQWQGDITCTCHCEARIVTFLIPVEKKVSPTTQKHRDDGNSSAISAELTSRYK